MKRDLRQIVEDYYKNSPDWPLPLPDDMERETDDFMRDGGDWTREQVRTAIEAFWNEGQFWGSVTQIIRAMR